MAEQEIDFNEIIESMGRFNEELIKAGVLLAGEGLTGPEEGFVVDFNADPPVVTDGPYTEAKELFNGFWILDVSSKEEAKQWAAQGAARPGREARGAPGVARPRSFPMDNPWIKKEIQWKAELAEKIAAQARADADKLALISPTDSSTGVSSSVRIDSRAVYLARIRIGPRHVRVRVEHLALLGDLDLAVPGEVARDVAGVVHQVAPVVAADRPGRVGRADASCPVHARGPARRIAARSRCSFTPSSEARIRGP